MSNDELEPVVYLTLNDLHGELLRLGLVEPEDVGMDEEPHVVPREPDVPDEVR
jgi:hypothetical protein